MVNFIYKFVDCFSDEDDDVLGTVERSPLSTGLNLPAPKHEPVQSSSVNGSNNSPAAVDSVFMSLPASKPTSQHTNNVTENDELEDMVKPKAAELAKRIVHPEKKKKKVIKISAPNLAEFDSDEDEAVRKPPKPSVGGCRLFSLLPEPKHVSIKESGRALIPHTLSKKTGVKSKGSGASNAALGSSTSTPFDKTDAKKSVSLLPGVPMEEDSDDEDNSSGPLNFFSIGTEHSKSNESGGLSSTSSNTMTTSTSNLAPVKHVSTETEFKSKDLSDTPLVFKSSTADLSTDGPLQFKSRAPPPSFVGPSVGPSPNVSQDNMKPYTKYGNQAYNLAGVDMKDYEDEDIETEEAGDNVVPAEELIRLQGKRKWGREAVNFIDVHADNYTSTVELTKNLTQEVDMVSHSKNKKDGPSGQQKRKHQITYLAHRAKEQEFELKNQWAQNKMTKNQTQSKYGF